VCSKNCVGVRFLLIVRRSDWSIKANHHKKGKKENTFKTLPKCCKQLIALALKKLNKNTKECSNSEAQGLINLCAAEDDLILFLSTNWL